MFTVAFLSEIYFGVLIYEEPDSGLYSLVLRSICITFSKCQYPSLLSQDSIFSWISLKRSTTAPFISSCRKIFLFFEGTGSWSNSSVPVAGWNFLNFAVNTTCSLNPFFCFRTFLSLTTDSGNSSMKTWTEAISSCDINLIVKKQPSKAWSVSSIVYLSFSNSIFWKILLLVFLDNLS
jgi:hypothetical protein